MNFQAVRPELLPGKIEIPIPKPEPDVAFEGYDPAALEVVNFLLCKIVMDHGPGSPDPKEYHNIAHSAQVVVSCADLGKDALLNENLEFLDFYALLIAGAGHDVILERRISDGDNERRSAKYAGGVILNIFAPTGYNDLKRRVTTLIPATITQPSKAGLLIQSADLEDYTSMLLCDADLHALGSDFNTYFTQAVAVFNEFFWDITNPEERQQGFIKFFETNLLILREQRFYTAEAKARYPNRLSNADEVERLLSKRSKPFMHIALTTN